jgi:hypothetical protein
MTAPISNQFISAASLAIPYPELFTESERDAIIAMLIALSKSRNAKTAIAAARVLIAMDAENLRIK